MTELLYVDCTLRSTQSRTRHLAEAFLTALPASVRVTRLELAQEPLRCLSGDFLEQRQILLAQGHLHHPRFVYAHQFAQADRILIAAPFWDLSIPALLKVYVENICVDGITFRSTADGLQGLCRADRMTFLTTRGGFYTGSPLEMGSRYMEAMACFFGIPQYDCVAADGMDVLQGADRDHALETACCRAAALAKAYSM